MVKILNTEKEDYHVHSFTFSDGFNTIDEIAKYAGEVGMKKIVITDHSQATLDHWGFSRKTFRGLIYRWKNVYNDVDISFGVEADLMNEKGDICDHIDNRPGDFLILSYHHEVYKGDKKKITQAFLKAIERHHERIKMIGHLHITKEIDFDLIIAAANKYNLPLEINCKYFEPKYFNPEAIKKIASSANSIYVNGDCHTLYDLANVRKIGFKFLKENGFI